MAYLEIPAVAGDQGARTHDLIEGTVSVGRGEGNDLVIIDGTLSRKHCELFKTDGGGWAIRDLASGNGVVLRGERITEAYVLNDGEPITLGSVVIVFRDLGADFPTLMGPPEAGDDESGADDDTDAGVEVEDDGVIDLADMDVEVDDDSEILDFE